MENELINGRTPEHIKAGLRCRVTGDAKCSDCAYYGTVLYEIGQREYECDDIDRDALALIEHLESERDAARAKVPKWISVKERLPKPFISVLVQMPGEKPCPTVREGYISNEGVWVAGYFKRDPDEVTHWMPMPGPQKEEEK